MVGLDRGERGPGDAIVYELALVVAGRNDNALGLALSICAGVANAD